MIIHHLESDKVSLQSQLQDLSISRQVTEDDAHKWKKELEARNRPYEEKVSSLAEAQWEVSSLKGDLASVEERVHASLQMTARASLKMEKMRENEVARD